MSARNNHNVSLDFYTVFDLDEYQNIQDTFSRNMGVSSITVLPSGKPITRPSNFCVLCEKYFCKCDEELEYCYSPNARIIHQNHAGPIITQCMDQKGLWNAGVNIVVDGVHLASWCVGQIKNEQVDEAYMLQVAQKNGFNTKDFKKALDQVPYMSRERFSQIANILFLFVNQLAEKAHNNLILQHQIQQIQKTNEQLIQSEKRYKLLFDQSNDAIFEVRLPDGQYVDANESASRLTGLAREDIIQLKTKDLTPKGAFQRLKQFMTDNHTFMASQVEYQRPDGSVRQTNLSVLPIDQHYVFGIANDITEQLKATNAIKHSHDLMQYIIEHSRSAIAVHDKDLRYVYVSQRYLEEYAIKGTQIIGKHHYEVFPDLPQKWREVHQKALKGEVCSAEEDEYPKEDGSVDWTRWECRPWFDQNHEIGGIIVYTEVISQRKKMELALRESEEKYKFLFYNNPQPSWIYDLESLAFLEVNHAAVLHYGYSREEFLNMTVTQIRPTEDVPKFMKELHINVAPEYINGSQWRHLKKNGEIIEVEISSHQIEYLGQKARHVLINDITQRVKTEQELRAAQEKAQESDRLKSAFLANMSHEIRTPLNSILGFSELLVDPDFNENDKKEFVEIMKQNSNRLLSLINDILDLSKIEAGEVRLQKFPIRIHELLDSIHRSQLLPANAKGLNLRLHTDGLEPDTILYTDGYRIAQILNNLINNAIKFTEKGIVEIGITALADTIRFHVKDTGIGIPAHFHERVFERFWQVDRGINRKFEGSGLGLTITKFLVEFLGGKIWLESSVGAGSIFYFTLPRLME